MASRMDISYLGPQATFTHQAAWRAFGEGAEYIPAETIDDVFTAVQEGEAHRGACREIDRTCPECIGFSRGNVCSLSHTGQLRLPAARPGQKVHP